MRSSSYLQPKSRSESWESSGLRRWHLHTATEQRNSHKVYPEHFQPIPHAPCKEEQGQHLLAHRKGGCRSSMLQRECYRYFVFTSFAFFSLLLGELITNNLIKISHSFNVLVVQQVWVRSAGCKGFILSVIPPLTQPVSAVCLLIPRSSGERHGSKSPQAPGPGTPLFWGGRLAGTGPAHPALSPRGTWLMQPPAPQHHTSKHYPGEMVKLGVKQNKLIKNSHLVRRDQKG